MKLTAIYILLFASFAARAETLSFTVNGKKTDFYRDAARHLTVSKSCVKKDDALQCDAYGALKDASLKGLTLKGGANPGAVVCSSGLGRTVVIGQDEHDNENSFCQFADGSLISNGSLSYYARKNDKN